MNHKVAIIGAGRLATSLVAALIKAEIDVIQIFSRTSSRAETLAKRFGILYHGHDIQALSPQATLVIMAVSDTAIAQVADKLQHHFPHHPAVFAHTSGSIHINALQSLGENVGVFYPMQIFTGESITPFTDVPLFLEGNQAVMDTLSPIAGQLSERVYALDSAGRERLHLGAVIACNFTNYLLRITASLSDEQEGIDFSIYHPLIKKHISQALLHHPDNTQTGPAVRGDRDVIEKHIAMLAPHPEWQSLYNTMTNLIMES